MAGTVKTNEVKLVSPNGLTEKILTIDNNGVISIDNIELTSGQIKFPTTQVPSSDANTLDDYKEGTWTPVITSAVGTITSYSVAFAKYLKIGNVVFLSIDFTITNVGSATGIVLVGGIPFATTRDSNGVGREMNATGVLLDTQLEYSSSRLVIRKYDNSAVIGNNYRYVCNIFYEV